MDLSISRKEEMLMLFVEYPKCTTCQKAKKWLDENKIEYESTGVKITSNTSVLRFNAASSDMRFRYYKSSTYSSQKAIQLYKYTEL